MYTCTEKLVSTPKIQSQQIFILATGLPIFMSFLHLKKFLDTQHGQCVQATGQGPSYYGAMVIDVSDLYEVTPTSACDLYP